MSPVDLPAVFGALADPTRLAIVERLLVQGPRTAGALAEPFALSRPAISKHLNVLERAGLLERRADRQWRVCSVRPEAIRALDDWMARYRAFWEGSFDRLDRFLESHQDREDDNDQ